MAKVSIAWTVIPDAFEAAPDVCPPATFLNPFVSQRFAMMDGSFRFNDRSGSGFRGFGTGRTFPIARQAGRRLRIGAVVDILEWKHLCTAIMGTTLASVLMCAIDCVTSGKKAGLIW